MSSEKDFYVEERITHCSSLKRRVKRSIKKIENVHNSEILDLYDYGRSLFMDSLIQSSEEDFHIYHEALVHPAMVFHKNPKRVLIAGGGELLTLAEVVKYDCVEKIDMVDIDGGVVEMCKAELPFLHGNAHLDKRVDIYYEDIHSFVEKFPKSKEGKENKKYDIIIYDIVDPCEGKEVAKVYTEEMFEMIKNNCMEENGIIVSQATSLQKISWETAARLRKTFENVFGGGLLYRCFCPSFLENWGFAISGVQFSKEKEIRLKEGLGVDKAIDKFLSTEKEKMEEKKEENGGRKSLKKSNSLEEKLKFYDEECHKGMFYLDKEIRSLIYSDKVDSMTMDNLSRFL